MFHAAALSTLDQMKSLRDAMFLDRAAQFVDRHGWPLPLASGGLEIDAFDDEAATYCAVEEGGAHRASLRLRPETAGSMVERHFPELWAGSEGRLRGGMEITRFCAAPGLSSEEREASVSDLLLGLCRHSQRTGARVVFGVVFPAVSRTIRQAGWDGEILGVSTDERGVLMLCQWTASELVAWNIQDRRDLRSRARADRRAAADLQIPCRSLAA